MLRDLHGLPPEEIAEVMEVSRSAADVLVHRARASFRSVFAKLAGEVPAPASLGLVLARLSVPAALHIMPPLPHIAAPAHPIPPHLAHLASQPHTGGLLNKLAGAASTKIAIGAAAALAVGGSVLAVRDVERSQGHRGPEASSRPVAASSTAFTTASSRARHEAHSRAHETHLAEHNHDAAHDGEHTSGDHSADHVGDSTQHDATSEHSGDHTTPTGDTHDAGTTSTSSGTSHDSTTTTHDGDHSGD